MIKPTDYVTTCLAEDVINLMEMGNKNDSSFDNLDRRTIARLRKGGGSVVSLCSAVAQCEGTIAIAPKGYTITITKAK